MLESILVWSVIFSFVCFLIQKADLFEEQRESFLAWVDSFAVKGEPLFIFINKQFACPLCLSFWISLVLFVFGFVPWYIPVSSPIVVKWMDRLN